ncbi:solute carrier family 25 protein [archaeon]|nr:MAG: solute carrier family 25 protein [archaeon]
MYVYICYGSSYSIFVASSSVCRSEGLSGFYAGWWPALAQKIPSYALTYVFFQQLKHLYIEKLLQKQAGNKEDRTRGIEGRGMRVDATTISPELNFILGALAAAASVTVMIPMDTIKTRLVVQTAQGVGARVGAVGGKLSSIAVSSISCTGALRPYKGVADCFVRIVQEEGVGALYRSLPPRLISVVPMIAIQFGVYEGLKSQFIIRNVRERMKRARQNGKCLYAISTIAFFVYYATYCYKLLYCISIQL